MFSMAAGLRISTCFFAVLALGERFLAELFFLVFVAGPALLDFDFLVPEACKIIPITDGDLKGNLSVWKCMIGISEFPNRFEFFIQYLTLSILFYIIKGDRSLTILQVSSY